MHEVVFSDKRQAAKGVKTGDIAKRLIDYGFHPYTVSFPMIVHGALMIEPTESESLQELDLFIEAMRAIAKEVEENPELVKTAPHSTRVSRLDEVQAARKPILRWKPNQPAPDPAQAGPYSAMENLPTADAFQAGMLGEQLARFPGAAYSVPRRTASTRQVSKDSRASAVVPVPLAQPPAPVHWLSPSFSAWNRGA